MVFKKRWMNLQLFAGDLDGVEDDDPLKSDGTEYDDDEDEDELDDGGEFDDDEFSKLEPGADEDEETGEDEYESDDDATAINKPTQQAPKSSQPSQSQQDAGPEAKPSKMFTHAEVEAMFMERLARDPYRNLGRRLEQRTGMTLQQLNEYADQKEEEEEVKKYAEEYMVEEDVARQHVRLRRENQRYQQEFPQVQSQLSITQEQLNYINDKARHRDSPYVRMYEAEIDAFAQNGKLCSFEAAMKYVLGNKLFNGEISSAIKRGATKKTLADIERQNRARVQQGSYSGKSGFSDGNIDPFQREFAAHMGIPLKEAIAENARVRRESRRRSR